MSTHTSGTYHSSLNAALAGIEQEIVRLTDLAAKLRDAGAISDGFRPGPNGRPRAAAPKLEKAAKPLPAQARGKRRSSEEIAELAQAVSDFVGTKGKEGASGTEITEKFGTLLPSIKAFVNGKLGDGKLKTKGAARQTRYFVG